MCIRDRFFAIDLDSFPDKEKLLDNIDDTLQDMKTSAPVSPEHPVYYPGENMMKTREENMRQGVPVDETIWNLSLIHI